MGGQQSSSDQSTDLKAVTVESSQDRHKHLKPQVLEREDKIKALTRLLTTQNRRRRDLKRDHFDYQQENMHMLKQVFKKMNPTITKGATYVTHGELQLSFKFDAQKSLLLVKVIRGRDLEAKDLRGKTANAYIRLHFHGSEEEPPQNTQVAKNTRHPTYHEIFSFNVKAEDLHLGRIVIQAWDRDSFDRDDLIGETIVGLAGMDLQTHPIHTAWYELMAETDLAITGEVEVSLSFKKPQTLLVTIHRGTELTNHYEEGNAPNPFVKMQIPGIAKVFETEVKYNTIEPVWDQTFEFTLRRDEIGSKELVLHVIDFDDDGANESLGQIIIELSNFNPEDGFQDSFKLADLKNTEKLRSKWFQPIAVQELRESLVAHACARSPQVLFQKHETSKIVRVMSCKTRTAARLRLINGVPVY